LLPSILWNPLTFQLSSPFQLENDPSRTPLFCGGKETLLVRVLLFFYYFNGLGRVVESHFCLRVAPWISAHNFIRAQLKAKVPPQDTLVSDIRVF
jgi:hypothetical protein